MRSTILVAPVAACLLCSQALAGLATHRAHAIHQIIDFSQTDSSLTTSGSYIDLPSSSFNLIIPPGADQLVLARFTAEVGIHGPDLQEWCTARIMAGNAEMTPNSGFDYADNAAFVANIWTYVGAGLDRSIVLHPGTYVIKVQYATNDTMNSCTLDDWHLNVMTADNGP